MTKKSRSFKMQLSVRPLQKKLLLDICRVYRETYNLAIDLQEFKFRHDYYHPEMCFKDILKFCRMERRRLEHIRKVDSYFFEGAVKLASYGFKLKLAAGEVCPDEFRIQENEDFCQLDRKDSYKVVKDSVDLPYVGTLKFCERNYVPEGSYIRKLVISRELNKWYLKFYLNNDYNKDCFANMKLRNKTLLILFDHTGSLYIDDKSFGKLTEQKNYSDMLKKETYLRKQLKIKEDENKKQWKKFNIKTPSKNMIKIQDDIAQVNMDMRNIKKDFFKKTVSSIRKEKPKQAFIPSKSFVKGILSIDRKQPYTRNSLHELLTMLEDNLTTIGTEIIHYESITDLRNRCKCLNKAIPDVQIIPFDPRFKEIASDPCFRKMLKKKLLLNLLNLTKNKNYIILSEVAHLKLNNLNNTYLSLFVFHFWLMP